MNMLRSVAFGVMARDAKVLASIKAVLYAMPNGAEPGLLAQDGGEISWYFQVGEVMKMKEVNAFLGCDITFSTSELVLSPHARSSE